MNILIINQFTGNKGDEAAGSALLGNLLERNDVDSIDIIYNSLKPLDVTDSRVSHHIDDMRLKDIGILPFVSYLVMPSNLNQLILNRNKKLKNMVECINKADYIFVTPCGASIGIYKDWRFLSRLLLVIKENKTPIFHLNTIGMSNNLIFNKLAMKVLKNSKLYVRERKSQNELLRLGLNSKLGPDTAFSLKPIYLEKKENIIGFVPTDLKWHPLFKKRNMEEILDNIIPPLIKFSLENNYKIRIIPHLGTEEESLFIRRLIEKYSSSLDSKSDIFEVCNVDNSYEYDLKISECKLMVGMRYHSVVLAAKNAVPFISLAYENKMKEVSHYTNMDEFCISLYTDNVHNLGIYSKLKLLEENSNQISMELKNIGYKLALKTLIPLSEIESDSM